MIIIGLGSALVNAPLRAVLITRFPVPDRPRATAAALTIVTAATPFGAILAAVALTGLPPSTAWTATVAVAAIVASTAIGTLLVRHRTRSEPRP